jgi:glycerol-3-phosphate dehydrogenase (NAD(P)+)
MKIGIIGAGSWGTALAIHCARLKHQVKLWVYEDDVYEMILQKKENTVYLPSFALSEHITPQKKIAQAMESCELIIVSIPSEYFRSIIQQMKEHLPAQAFIVSATKGIENNSYKRMSEILVEELGVGLERIGAISGPSFAREVALAHPTAVTIGSVKKEAGMMVQRELSSRTFRIYGNKDIIGVELGGSLKNIIAIAAGIIEGLGYGHNTTAALITRGLAEMMRLARAMKAKPETLSGLSGLGDLVLTCTSSQSRNRTVGFKLGQGIALSEILAGMRMVAEGVATSKAVMHLKDKYQVEMPIVDQVYSILYLGKNPKQAIDELMLRDLKEEFAG